MSVNIYQAPKWLHKSTTLTGLVDCKTELLNYLITKNNHKDVDRLHSLFYSYFNVPEFLTQCPTVKQKLDEFGLTNYYTGIEYYVENPSINLPHPVHVDGAEPALLSVALFVPILNCNDSYNVWYDGKIDYTARIDLKYISYVDDDTLSMEEKCMSGLGTYLTVLADQSTVTTIESKDNTTPYWMNVQHLHNQVNLSNSTSVSCTIRFTSEILEMIASGEFDAILVKQ